MERRILLVAFAAIAITATGTAQLGGLGDAVERYNNNSDQLPGLLGAIVGDQKVNVYINVSDGSQESFAVRMDGLDMEMQNETFTNHTIQVTATQEALMAVMGSDTPREEFSSRKKAGEITFAANGLLNKIRVAVVDFFI